MTPLLDERIGNPSCSSPAGYRKASVTPDLLLEADQVTGATPGSYEIDS
jgi:hypothetical protein